MDATEATRNETLARWVVRLDAGPLSPEEQRELDAWLDEKPSNRGALLRARAEWIDLDRLGALSGGSGDTADAAKKGDIPDSVGVKLRPSGPLVARRWLLAAGLAAVSVAIAGYVAVTLTRDVYVSDVGEVRRVTLADGSTMILNTATRAVVRFDEGQRLVRLERGEALFQVQKDSSRPFIVRTHELTVKAVGTAFAVRVVNERTAVTVTEGVVEIARSATPSLTRPGDSQYDVRPQRVTANHRAIVPLVEATKTTATSPPITVEPIEPQWAERQLAWRGGMVAFNGESLREAVDEMNRHNHRQIVIDDPALSAQPVVGIFSANDIEDFAQTAAAAFGAEAHARGDTVHLTSRQGVGEN